MCATSKPNLDNMTDNKSSHIHAQIKAPHDLEDFVEKAFQELVLHQ